MMTQTQTQDMTAPQSRRRCDDDDLRAWKRWKRSPSSCHHEQLVARFDSAVRSIAKRRARMMPAHVDVDDLISVGYMGLLTSLESYDPSHGAPLGAWVAARVSGAILDEVRRDSRLPRSVVDRQKQIAAATRKLECVTGRPPTRAQVACEAGMTVDELREHESDMLRGMVESLDRQIGPGDGADQIPLVDMIISGDRDCDPVWSLNNTLTSDAVQVAVSRMDDQERLVYASLYGDDASYGQCADMLGVSTSRVGQINKRVQVKLRDELVAQQLVTA